MPGFDGTGPRGFGPGSGRAMGPCQASTMGRPCCGQGRGYGRGFLCKYSKPIQAAGPSEQLKFLAEEKARLEQKIAELEKELK